MNNLKLALVLQISLALFIVCFIKRLSFLDPVIIKNPRLTIWSLTHLTWFFIMGKVCPNNFLVFFIMGIIWEIFEKCYGQLTDKECYWTSNGYTGQIYDIVMNSIGYFLAHKI